MIAVNFILCVVFLYSFYQSRYILLWNEIQQFALNPTLSPDIKMYNLCEIFQIRKKVLVHNAENVEIVEVLVLLG